MVLEANLVQSCGVRGEFVVLEVNLVQSCDV